MKSSNLILKDELPTSKMQSFGANHLSNGELLSIVLGGSAKNSYQAATNLLASSDDGLCSLSEMTFEKLCQTAGVNEGGASRLLAAFELGKRLNASSRSTDKTPVRTAEDAYKLIAPKLRLLDHEEFWVLFLNRNNLSLGLECMSIGNVCSTSVDVPRIIKRSLEKNATGIIMFHNHPSGNPNPGSNDINATNKLRKALEIMEKTLIDHIIVTDRGYYSFAMEKSYDVQNETK